MSRFVADENFDGHILRGLLQRNHGIDIVRVQDIGLLGASDPEILAWAAREGRLLLTHDIKTIPRDAFGRVHAGQEMPGVIAIRRSLSIGSAIDDILLLIEGSREGEWDGQVVYLPL